MLNHSPARFSGVLLVGLALLLPACDGWKNVDRHAGLIFVPNVDPVEVDGRALIRMKGREAEVYVDPVGGRITSYYLKRRSIYRYDTGADGQFEGTAREFAARGNVLAGEGWRAQSIPEHPALDDSAHWQVDGRSIYLALLSDRVDGLRWRKEFELYDNGVLDVTVTLENLSGSPRELGAVSLLDSPGGSQPEPGNPPATTAPSGPIEHRWVDGQWFSRAMLGEAPGFTLPVRTVPAGGQIRWTERWWLTAAPKDAPPPTKVKEPEISPVDRYVKDGNAEWDGYPRRPK